MMCQEAGHTNVQGDSLLVEERFRTSGDQWKASPGTDRGDKKRGTSGGSRCEECFAMRAQLLTRVFRSQSHPVIVERGACRKDPRNFREKDSSSHQASPFEGQPRTGYKEAPSSAATLKERSKERIPT